MEVKRDSTHDARQRSKRVHEVRSSYKIRAGIYALVSLALLVFYFLIRLNVIIIAGRKLFFQRSSLALFIIFLILFISQILQHWVVKSRRSKAYKYNAFRVLHLLAVILITIVGVSYMFQNWYTAAVSLGLISLVLGFALQGPISSLIGWIYIVFRSPFEVGDRIEIGEFKGDVVEVGYIDTTLSEFGAPFLSNDLPSGRLIRFPNSLVLQSAVFNYSWQDFPFIWNEIAFQIAYNSDLSLVKSVIRDVTLSILDPEITDNVQELKDLISGTPVENLPMKEYPIINFRINDNTWVEAVVTYVVQPKRAASTRTKIIEKTLEKLNRHQDRVLMPKGENR